MSALAEPAIELTDDRLAARNAVVLAVVQALAGGNNTVITATTGIVGSVLAPDPALATLPISVMVAGMWIGTLRSERCRRLSAGVSLYRPAPVSESSPGSSRARLCCAVRLRFCC